MMKSSRQDSTPDTINGEIDMTFDANSCLLVIAVKLVWQL